MCKGMGLLTGQLVSGYTTADKKRLLFQPSSTIDSSSTRSGIFGAPPRRDGLVTGPTKDLMQAVLTATSS